MRVRAAIPAGRARALAAGCSVLSLALLAATHFLCYCCFPAAWDGHGAYLYRCVAFEWQFCWGLLLLCYALAGVGLSVGLLAEARRSLPGVVSVGLALGVLAMEVALHTLPRPPACVA